jgi:hypothetical protein
VEDLGWYLLALMDGNALNFSINSPNSLEGGHLISRFKGASLKVQSSAIQDMQLLS